MLEVTESIFILHYERHVKILNTLRAKGIGVALDDFGCGYSSLNHLRHLPIDWVKIDRSFISALESDAGSREVVSALFGLCQAMHLPVVAEGVETEGQREILKALGCRVMQGFLLWPRRRRKSRLWPRRCHNLLRANPDLIGFLMSGNTLGTLFTVTNFGESHGPAIGCVVDGCPA